MIRNSIIKIISLMLIIGLNWAGLSAVGQTFAYFFDNENSNANLYQAGILDFSLSSTADFSPSSIDIGESASRTISIINLGNQHKYTITAANFSADVCDYLYLEASLNEGDAEYSGLLKDFVDFGPTVFEGPADWNFVLTLPADAPQEVLGQTCDFDFVFFGSQTRHNLPFGTGFTDTEQISNSIAAAVCYDVEIRSMGYWKNHSNIYKPYLPQYLGGYPEGEIIDTVEKAQQVFHASPTPMENMLKKHLLAMKFNLAHFGIGGYLVESEGKTLDQIAAEADALLLDPEATEDDLEAMKDLLGNLNELGQIRYCYVLLPEVEVIVPDGGEQWWVGHYYDIAWQSSNLDCPDDNSEVSIWYSADSGTTWANIVQSTDNDGVYNWRASLLIGDYYVPSSNARIKIVARCSETQTVVAWDMSDEDFCPPIDYDLLTPEEIEFLKDMGIIAEEEPEAEDETEPEIETEETSSEETDSEDQEVEQSQEEEPVELPEGRSEEDDSEDDEDESSEESDDEASGTEDDEEPLDEETNEETEGPGEEPIVEEEPISEEEPIEDTEPLVEEPAEEKLPTEEEPVEEGVNEDEEIGESEETEEEEVSDENTENTEDILGEETDNDESEENSGETGTETEEIIEETPSIEEQPTDEAPAVDEQPATVPDGASSTPDGSGESISDGGIGDTGGSLSGSSPAEGAGESSIDSGATGDTVSE